MRRDALDHIAQIHERIDLQVLAGLDQRTKDGGSVRRRFAPREQPVFSAQHDRSRRAKQVLDPLDPARISAAESAAGGLSSCGFCVDFAMLLF
jgi:hypothetical protein